MVCSRWRLPSSPLQYSPNMTMSVWWPLIASPGVNFGTRNVLQSAATGLHRLVKKVGPSLSFLGSVCCFVTVWFNHPFNTQRLKQTWNKPPGIKRQQTEKSTTQCFTCIFYFLFVYICGCIVTAPCACIYTQKCNPWTEKNLKSFHK